MSNALPAGMFSGISAAGAAKAYQSVDTAAQQAGDAGGFSALLNRALEGAVNTGQQAETHATEAIAGHGDLTQVVTAVSRAELALQTTVAVRDRVLSAYQDIIKMPI
jgi:flagellar hook-basal body complex protein FliE